MAGHRIYFSILEAVQEGRLIEPFGSREFEQACPGFASGTYQVFLPKHRKGNPVGNSELFEQVDRGIFRVIRPFKYQTHENIS